MQKAASKPHELPKALRRRLVDLSRTRGLRAVASQIGISPQTLASLAAGIRANASTVALVERRLAEIDIEKGAM
jgi:hypothetical protein